MDHLPNMEIHYGFPKLSGDVSISNVIVVLFHSNKIASAKIVMVGNTPVSTTLDIPATLIKESPEAGIQLHAAENHQTIVFQSAKQKAKQIIHLNDVYAVVQNGSELKLESCPRVVKHHWNPFRKADKVCFLNKLRGKYFVAT